MIASDVKQAGFYWYLVSGSETTIVEYLSDCDCFLFIGNDSPYMAFKLPGQFIGPFSYQQQG